jgi:hypothetical protein
MVDNALNFDSYITTPSSQTYRTYLQNQYGPGVYLKFIKFEHVKIQLVFQNKIHNDG